MADTKANSVAAATNAVSTSNNNCDNKVNREAAAGETRKVAGNNFSDESGYCEGDDDIEVLYDKNAERNNNRKNAESKNEVTSSDTKSSSSDNKARKANSKSKGRHTLLLYVLEVTIVL